LFEVLVMEEHHVVVDHLVRRRVDATNSEGPVTGEDRSLYRDVLPQPPAEDIDQPPANDRRRPLADECLLLIGRKGDLWVHLEIRLRLDGELREEALAVPIAPAEPVRPAH